MTFFQQFRRKTRLLLEAVLPAKLMAVISLLYPPRLFFTRFKQEIRHARYLKATANLGADEVLFENAHRVRVTPEARETYLQFCWRDARMVVEISNFLKLTQDRKCFYDIGAFQGVFSFSFCAATGGQAFAFEPSPPAVAVLRKVMALNPELNVAHQPVAIGKTQGEISMKADWQHLIALPAGEEAGDEQRVDVQSLDHFILSNPPPDCIKIDVEGFEYEVLLGARETLSRHHPLLFLEIHPPDLLNRNIRVEEVFDYLKQLNYEILKSDLKPLRLPSDKAITRSRVFNVICQ